MSCYEKWDLFLNQCLGRRVRPEDFERLVEQLFESFPVKGRWLAGAVVKPRLRTASVDPLVLVYVDRLLSLNRISVPDLLTVLLEGFTEWQTNADNGNAAGASEERRIPLELEEALFYRIAKSFGNGERPKNVAEARRSWQLVSQWMSAMVNANAADSMIQAVTGNTQQLQPQSILVREAFAMLLVTLSENGKMVNVLDTSFPKDASRAFSQSLALFIPLLSQTSVQVANRLEMFQKQHAAIAAAELNDLSQNPAGSSLDTVLQVDAVVDLPLFNSRAGLYIFVNAMLAGRPLSDDNLILNHLHMRYKGDVQSMTIDLIIASFDVLSNAMYRNEPSHVMFSMRSFLINKVPTLVIPVAATTFPPLNTEFCIGQALSQIDANAFPPFSQAFNVMSGTGMLSDVRQDFLFACALHQLIPEESVERLLGEAPVSNLPVGGRYAKEVLISQCAGNSERVEELLNDIENIDGNAGAIVAALTEIIRNMCVTRETMSLKAICNLLSRRPHALDVFLQFTSPVSVLQPLCQLLDTWKYEDDQGEYQPVYDEFGAILLLVLAFVHRYDLTESEIGLSSSSFVSRLLRQQHADRKADELEDTESKRLGGWIRGLLDPEGSISDELMSTCRPQEFYLLVPSLFQQIIMACTLDAISFETVKGALDYLLEAFLQPSLVGAIAWISSHGLDQGQGNLDISMQILHKLIRPASIPGDAQAMHATILCIVSSRLEQSLRMVRRRHPTREDVATLLESLKPHLGYVRTAQSRISELESWTSPPGSNLKHAMKSCLHSLMTWTSPPAPNYTHKLLVAALEILGAKTLIWLIVEEIKSQTGNASLTALDVGVALICAPSTENSPVNVDWITSPVPAPVPPKTRLNLRDALRLEIEDAAKLFITDPLAAETMVRLHRRVEAQLAGGTGQDLNAPLQSLMQPMDITVSDAAAAAASMESALDLSGTDGGLGLGSTAPVLDLGPGDAMLGDPDDDIFSGLMLD